LKQAFEGPGGYARADYFAGYLLPRLKSGSLRRPDRESWVMVGTVLKQAGERAGRCMALIVATACSVWLAGDIRSVGAQTAPSAEEARLLEFGKEIFKSKAVCQYCHKWDASGDQGYGGNALSLRATHLTPE